MFILYFFNLRHTKFKMENNKQNFIILEGFRIELYCILKLFLFLSQNIHFLYC